MIEAVGHAREARLKIAVVGKDDQSPYRQVLERHNLTSAVQFLPPRPDPEFYYAAADVYTGPSREDAFGMPPLEAMACGVPAIVSRQSGVSEIVTHGVDGFILENPQDYEKLKRQILKLYEDAEFRQRLSEKAAETARCHTWSRNARECGDVLRQSLARKQSDAAATLRHEA